MTEPTPWQQLWREINSAMDFYGSVQAEATSRLLKDVRIAVRNYGEAVDPSSFDELGQPIEPENGG